MLKTFQVVLLLLVNSVMSFGKNFLIHWNVWLYIGCPKDSINSFTWSFKKNDLVNTLSLHQIWHILDQLMLRKKDAWNWTIVADSLKIKTEIFSWEKTKTVYSIQLNIHGLSSVLAHVQLNLKTQDLDQKNIVIYQRFPAIRVFIQELSSKGSVRCLKHVGISYAA